MRRKIIVHINGRELVAPVPRSLVTVRETDLVQFTIQSDEGDAPSALLIGDAAAQLQECVVDGKTLWQSPSAYYFAECFGHAGACVLFAEDAEYVDFDVLASKTNVEQARKMIAYLASHHESLISACLARTTRKTGTIPEGRIDPETLLSSAEIWVGRLQELRNDLVFQMRERLEPRRAPLWEVRNAQVAEVDPVDLLANLDALVPSASSGDVLLFGRHYDLSNMNVTLICPTRDVLENRVLLGGLYSMRRRIGELHDELRAYDNGGSNPNFSEFESLSRLMLSITASGMLRRCVILLNSIANFIRLFEQRFGVTYEGEIAPAMTPHARSNRVYREMFFGLSRWYELGKPSMDGIHFLMKLRSLNEIFEFFTLFHLIDELRNQGWQIKTAVPDTRMDGLVPASVVFTLGDEHLQLEYEPKIVPNATYGYWTPDFVLRLSKGQEFRYLILDAKYSRRETVRKYSLPDLLRKYYHGMCAYNASRGTFSHDPIVGVFAVYALDYQPAGRYLNHWGKHGMFDDIVRLPMLGGIGLMVDNAEGFKHALATAMTTTRRLLSRLAT